MKKILYLLFVSLFVFTSCNQEDEIIDTALKSKKEKVTICHYDSYSDTWKSISINGNALEAHLNHGDRVGGGCEDYTYVPDDNFEQKLIDLGYDDTIDDYVLTSNINNVLSLWIYEHYYDSDGYPITEVQPWEIFSLTGIEDFISLEWFGTNARNVTALNLTNNKNLNYLSLHHTPINNLDLTKNILLDNLNIDNIPLNSLDLTQNINLRRLQYGSTESLITNIDLSNNKTLEILFVLYSRLISLDLSQNNSLKELHVIGNNNLSSLNIKNGYNTTIQTARFINNANLDCIEVDDAAYSNSNWVLSQSGVFSENCGYE